MTPTIKMRSPDGKSIGDVEIKNVKKGLNNGYKIADEQKKFKMRSPDGEIGNVNLKNVKEALNDGYELVGQEGVKIRRPWGDELIVHPSKLKDALNDGGQLVIEPSAFFKVLNPVTQKRHNINTNRLQEALNDGLELVNEANISDYAQAFTGGIIKNLVQVTDVVTNLIQQPEKTNLSDNNK